MIAIIDYGLGNIMAFANVYQRLNIPFVVAKTAADLAPATKLILPGVGAFDHAMERLEQSGMRGTLDELVQRRAVPVLGVCVGMQMMGRSSEEGRLDGLGWIDGRVMKFDLDDPKRPLPHMGWNDVRPLGGSDLLAGLEQDARFYFLHSYYFQCADRGNVLAESDYGLTFSSMVHAAHIYGVQFHPEKSHHFGTRLLKNFSDL